MNRPVSPHKYEGRDNFSIVQSPWDIHRTHPKEAIVMHEIARIGNVILLSRSQEGQATPTLACSNTGWKKTKTCA
jgi:hypothetical protein